MVVKINGVPFKMEIDTGPGVTIMQEEIFLKHWPTARIHPSALRLRTWTGAPVAILGYAVVQVNFKGRQQTLALHVGSGKGPLLLGRVWFRALKFAVAHGKRDMCCPWRQCHKPVHPQQTD